MLNRRSVERLTQIEVIMLKTEIDAIVNGEDTTTPRKWYESSSSNSKRERSLYLRVIVDGIRRWRCVWVENVDGTRGYSSIVLNRTVYSDKEQGPHDMHEGRGRYANRPFIRECSLI